MRFSRLALLVVVVAFTGLFVFFGVCAATTTPSRIGGKPNIKLRHGTSVNWSGYAVETDLLTPQNYAVSDVKGQWTVPSVTGTTNAYSSTWIGIDGYSDNTVEQIGTEQDWINGVPVYYAWYEMYPKPSYRINSLAIRPGDQMAAEVKYVGSNTYSLTLSNLSTGKSFTTIQKAKARRQSAEWVVEAPWSGGVLPLANFGTVTFSGAYAVLNNHLGSISDSAWKNDPITMVSSSSTNAVKAQPSALSPDGTGFGVTWYSSK